MLNNLIGKRIGNYELIDFIGRGAFADVYLGKHINLHTKAAVKMVRANLALLPSEAATALWEEAQKIAKFKHEHIVRVLDLVKENDTPFLVIEYCPNGTLRTRHLRGTCLPAEDIVLYVRDAASALQYAHDRNLVHCDIKPENMLLGENNELLLSDFGAAIVIHSSSSANGQKRVMGTLRYMAPEQILGQAVPASDQYALAVVVYEWLTGELPFTGSTDAEIMLKHAQTPPQPLREKNPLIGNDVEQVVLKALAKKPGQRYPTIQKFAEAFLAAAGKTEQMPSSQPDNLFVSFFKNVIRWMKEKRWLAASFLLALGVSAFLLSTLLPPATPTPATPTNVTVTFAPKTQVVSKVFTFNALYSTAPGTEDVSAQETGPLSDSLSKSGTATKDDINCLPLHIDCQTGVGQDDVNRLAGPLQQTLETVIDTQLNQEVTLSDRTPISKVFFSDLNITSDPAVNQPVVDQTKKQFSVTVTETGKLEYVDNTAVTELMHTLLAQEAPDFDIIQSTYQQRTLAVPPEDLANAQIGDVYGLRLAAGAVMVYRFASAMLRSFQISLEGKSSTDARAFLQLQQGIDSTTISIQFISGNGPDLPENPRYIQIKALPPNLTNLPPIALPLVSG